MSVERDIRRYAYIDALRGLAFLMVLVVHVFYKAKEVPTGVANVLTHGDKGVQLFYVVSALTLFMSMAQRTGRERRPYAGFFLRRFFRIAPMFYVLIAIGLLMNGTGTSKYTPHGITPAHLITTATFTNGWSPYWITGLVSGGWSVAIEMMFYLLVPILFLSIRTLRGALWLVLGSLAVCLAWNELTAHWQPIPEGYMWGTSFTYFALPSQGVVFAMGILCYFMLKKLEAQRLDGAESKRWGVVLLIASVGLGLLSTREGDAFLPWHVPGHVVCAGVFAMLALALSLHPSILLVNPIMRFIGMVSYSAYLTHFLVLEKVTQLVDGTLGLKGVKFIALVLALTLLATVVISTATYFLIEVPGQRLGKKIINRLQRGPVPAAEGASA